MQDFCPLYLWRYTEYSQNNQVKIFLALDEASKIYSE